MKPFDLGSLGVALCGLLCAWPAQAAVQGDFNGDGFADLAVGVPSENVGSLSDAGAISILYGSASGLGSAGNQLWNQDSSGITDRAEAGDHFGSALATGDFNGDGFADLAVGVPSEDTGSVSDAGAVSILYGSASGLTSAGNQFWAQDSPGINDHAEADDLFGSTLATSDFDGDGFADLAVGVPSEDTGSLSDAGVVNILYGSASGLASARNQIWGQDSPGINDRAEADDLFGSVLAAGDFDGDGNADLAVGVPSEDTGSVSDAGLVNVLYGAASGLISAGNQIWAQDSPGINDRGEPGDLFGSALATGDFDGDGNADLAVGVPSEDTGSVSDAGVVNVLFGSASGLAAAGNQLWSQDSSGIEDTAEAGDLFGSALVSGDFDGFGVSDLAIGVPSENTGPSNAGAVSILYGSASGLTSAGNQFWHQDSSGIKDNAEAGDLFGSALATADFQGDGVSDLAVGVPSEDVGPVSNAGAVNVLHGSGSGLTSVGNQFWSQNSSGIGDAAEAGDLFGSALAPQG